MACHHYSNWRYPTPQHCRNEIAYVPRQVASIAPPPPPQKPEILKEPTNYITDPGIIEELKEELDRMDAIRKLKSIMNR
jgi:hypothetical protein